MKKALLIALAVFVSVLLILPANAWVTPGTPTTFDDSFEMFGPRLDRIKIKMYNGQHAMWTNLAGGEIDVTDWPLNKYWFDEFDDPAYSGVIKKVPYPGAPNNGEAGMYLFDLNHNNNTVLGNPPGFPKNPDTGQPYPNPLYGYPEPGSWNPCSNVWFRRALAYLTNRTYLEVDVLKGLGIVMYTPVPSYMEPLGWVNRYIKPGGALESLCYLYDETAAETMLANGGFKKDTGTGKYYWDKNGNNVKDTGEAIKVKMWVRSDHEGRKKMGEQLAASMAKIGIDYEINYGGGGVCYQHYMLEKDGTLYTAGWIFIGPEPDFLYDLFHSSMHWHSPESSCPNTMFINDPVYDTYSYNVKFATSIAAANESAWNAQQRFAEMAHAIPLYCNLGVKASRVTYLGDGAATGPEDIYEGKNWWQIVNEQGFGTNSWYTFLNAQPEGFMYGNGNMSMRYGWSSIYYPTHLNILYAEWYWDFEILGKIYDTLATRDPNMRSVFLPWMVKTWETGKWPITATKMADKLRITLRPDIRWHDGTPLTVADLYFTFAEVTPMLLAKGYPPPWWYSAVQYLISCYIVDPYTIEMLFSVESVWIEGWVLIASPIVPKHIWKPIIETGDPTLFQPDVNMIGSGPWKLVGYTPMTSAELDANKDYFRYLPVEVNVHADNYKAKFLLEHAAATAPPPPHQMLVNFTITLHNLFLNASEGSTLTVDKYVYIDDQLEAGYPITGITLQTCVPETETVSKVLGRGRHSITVAVKITGPAHLTYEGVQQDNPWLDRWVNETLYVWVTIVEDIASTDAYWLPLFKNAGVQHPDNAVGMKDLYECVLAFATSPGHPKWNSICDINGDYKADMKDLYGVVLMFGKW